MARAQFEYDEVGNTFYYVIVSFFAVIVFPLTHFLWPSLPKKVELGRKNGCRCEGDLAKRAKLEAVKPWEQTKRAIKAIVLIVMWAIFILFVYKVTQIKHENTEYDPYKILGLDPEADVSEIKKRYRELSKIHHPDKGGDAQTFDDIVKAYKALTDEEIRQNWKLHGNPDGPRATTFGIALPKWIVSDEYGIWVLALYGVVFMVILPIIVGLWWYNSMKYSADKVLLETTRLYYYFLQKTPNMEINRILMVLAGSFEFWKKFNNEIVERESDDIEVPRVMKELKNLGENKKEAPFCHPWSVKARTLLHAYLTRVELDSERLESDQQYMLAHYLALMEEFLRVLLQMMLQIPMQRPPSLETLEHSIKLFPMVVQALWPRNSSLLQLPHVTEQNIPYLRKNRIITCQDLANLNEFKRRSLLNTISFEQYEDVIHVLSMMPKLEVDARIEVQGEEDKETVTVGSVVTLKVTLKRQPLLDGEKRERELAEGPQTNSLTVTNKCWAAEKETEQKDENEVGDEAQQLLNNKRKVWEKQPKKKAKKGGKSGAKQQPQQRKKVALVVAATNPVEEEKSNNTSANPTPKATPKVEKPKKKVVKRAENEKVGSDSDGGGSSTNDELSNADDDSADEKEHQIDGGSSSSSSESEAKTNRNDDDDDDEIWKEHEKLAKKETLLDSEPTTHHEVHCPYYPLDKYEWWYLYLVERKSRRLVSMVVPCKTLDREKTVELRFSAPPQKGVYYFTLNVRSDSYFDSDYSVDVKMEVHAARDPPVVKYEDTDDEEEEKGLSASSEDYTEGSDSELED